MANFFTPDLFTCAELSGAVMRLPWVPSLLRPYFTEEGVRTTSITIDLDEVGIKLVSDSPRGSVGGQPSQGGPRKVVTIPSAHLSLYDTVHPEDVQDVRAFNSTEPETIANRLARKQAALRRDIEATLEYHRVGAVKGQVLDADGSTVLFDSFAAFGKTKATKTIAFPATAGAKNTLLRNVMDIVDTVDVAMGGNAYGPLMAICGANFWKWLTTGAETRAAYDQWYANHAAQFNHEDFLSGVFDYGGIRWCRYHKTVGGNALVATDKAHVFPTGNGIFRTFYAPADYVETVNTDGQAFYSRMEPKKFGKGYELEVQCNPISLCMFPEALVEVTGTEA